MRAERFGSYSIVATFAGMPSLLRLKSMSRYSLRVPPPLWRTVICPLKLRPECFLRTSSKDRSGSTLLRSEKSIVVMKRLAGLVGLYFFTGMAVFPSRVFGRQMSMVALACRGAAVSAALAGAERSSAGSMPELWHGPGHAWPARLSWETLPG